MKGRLCVKIRLHFANRELSDLIFILEIVLLKIGKYTHVFIHQI